MVGPNKIMFYEVLEVFQDLHLLHWKLTFGFKGQLRYNQKTK